jgi:hypothetical protein
MLLAHISVHKWFSFLKTGKAAAFSCGRFSRSYFLFTLFDISSEIREALIKSLSAFILEFLCNARNGKGNSELSKESHDEAVHKILIKADSMN